ncbi:MAG: helix-turn-helix domain-containing protein [Clostridia bacterium]|nr:helix-turn-helix domain-containing protein [Clostridia bacterium]
MSVGTVIKKLRHDRKMTQEALAEYLGVSTNAVSQWECDKTAPDISHIPVLANVFEVSADVLLEIDIAKSRKKAELDDFTRRYHELHSKGKNAERLELCRGMQKKYPNDETVRFYLLCVLQNAYIDECFDEITSLGEQLLDSSDIEHKTGAICALCLSYLHKGDKKKAMQYAEMMPPGRDLRVHVLEGDPLVEHCQNYFWKLCDEMYLYMGYLLKCKESGYTHEQKHTAWKNLCEVFCMIFPDGDFGFWEERLARVCFFMSMESMKMGEHDRALDELEQMLTHIECFQNFTSLAHTSLLVNKVKSNREDFASISEETFAQTQLRYLTNHEDLFAPIKDSPRYLRLKERLICLAKA